MVCRPATQHPAPKLIKRVDENMGLPLQRGHSAIREKRINEEEEELIREMLRDHAYDLTFKQLGRTC